MVRVDPESGAVSEVSDTSLMGNFLSFCSGAATVSGFCPGALAAGALAGPVAESNVPVEVPVFDEDGQPVDVGEVEVTFGDVQTPGQTTSVLVEEAGAMLGDFMAVGLVFDISTTAEFASEQGVVVCLPYDETAVPLGDESQVRLLHLEMEGWVELPGQDLDTEANRVCATTTSFSEFAAGVAVASNEPPVAVISMTDDTVEATSPGGALVALDGSTSFDPDGDDLTFRWEGPFATIEDQEQIQVTLPLSNVAHVITLTVSDPDGESSSDSVSISVVDTTAPEFASIAAVMLEAIGVSTQSVLDAPQVTDAVGVVSLTNDAPANRVPPRQHRRHLDSDRRRRQTARPRSRW